MNKVACFIDAQGFTLANEFIVREIAVVAESIKLCFDCETNLTSFNKTIKFQQMSLHGLSLRPSKSVDAIPQKKVDEFIEFLFDFMKSDEKPLVALKNQQLEKIIKKLGIPFVSLENLSFVPKLGESFSSNQVECKKHFFETKNCALAKCCFYWNFVQNNLKQ